MLPYQIPVDIGLTSAQLTHIQNLSLIIYAIQLTGSALMWYSRVERGRGREILPILALLMLVLRLGFKKKYCTTKSQKPVSTVGAGYRGKVPSYENYKSYIIS
jgi:hypothetical protein